MKFKNFLDVILESDQSLNDFIDEQTEEIEEINSTSAVGGYDTPQAFSKNEKPKHNGAVLGYVPVEKSYVHTRPIKEVRYKDYKRSEGSSKKKIQGAIAEMNSNLYKLERIVKQNIRLKQESGVSSDTYNAASRTKLTKIAERLIKLSEHIRRMGE